MRIALVIALILVAAGGAVAYFRMGDAPATAQSVVQEEGGEKQFDIPRQKILTLDTHVWQTFNNCSSVALMIALSHWGIADTQEAIAEATRPINNKVGDNDDKSVTLHELGEYAGKYGLAAYVRPDGDIETLKKFIANDIPVVTRALMYPDKDYVHYRVVKGYDDVTKTVIESDGVEGKHISYSYDKWMHLWKDYNYSYLIVVPLSKIALVEEILGAEKNEKTAWQNAKARSEAELVKDAGDLRAHYNLVTALYYLGDYKGTVREFEKIENKLPPHMLWYQYEPIEAYFKLGNYERVLALADSVINANNKAVSELYILKGEVYRKRGDIEAARAEFEKAVFYNKHLKAAKEALASVDVH